MTRRATLAAPAATRLNVTSTSLAQHQNSENGSKNQHHGGIASVAKTSNIISVAPAHGARLAAAHSNNNINGAGNVGISAAMTSRAACLSMINV